MKKKFRGKKMFIICLSIVLIVLVILGFVFPPSFGKIKPLRDSEGNVLQNSIAEKIDVSINNVNQGMIIKGESLDNPVLLIVHGGPGLSDYFLSTLYETGLEKEFIVCYWDQRGTGLSYDKDMDVSTMNKDQLISDTIEVTEYLRQRFNQEKIFILGHSWGTYLGLMAAKQAPQLYYAYIGMSQVVNQIESEKEAFQYMLDVYLANGNQKRIKQMNAYQINDSEADLMKYRKSGFRDQIMHELGVGTMHAMDSVITGLFFPSLRCTDYTMKERIDIWKGKVYSSRSEMLFTIDSFDARVDVIALDIPIYLFAGIYDYTTTYRLQKEFFDAVNAPVKGFYTFYDSAHSPLFEEPEFAMQILKEDVLHLNNSLSD